MKIAIADVAVRDRFRKDMGDLNALADSIAQQGLLQPIGVTEDRVLVFGERRLVACRDILGLVEIDARIVSVTSIVEGEYAENEIRKDFTVSERVAIGRAVETAIGDRRGTNQHSTDEERKNFYTPQNRTSEVAAKKAGFGSHTTYEAAKRVIERAVPGLVDALDRGDVSVAAALVASVQEPEEQKRFVSVSKAEQRKAVRDWREFQKPNKPQMPEWEEIETVALAFRQIADRSIAPARLVAKALPASLIEMKEHGRKVRGYLDAIERANLNDEARAS
jgi:hypothetical protein